MTDEPLPDLKPPPVFDAATNTWFIRMPSFVHPEWDEYRARRRGTTPTQMRYTRFRIWHGQLQRFVRVITARGQHWRHFPRPGGSPPQ